MFCERFYLIKRYISLLMTPFPYEKISYCNLYMAIKTKGADFSSTESDPLIFIEQSKLLFYLTSLRK